MTNLSSLAHYLPDFLFILLRVGVFFSVVPFFGSGNFPPTFKIGVAVAVAMVLTPVVQVRVADGALPLVVMREVMFSVTLALAVRFVFLAVEAAGQTISNAMGLSIASVFNPELGQSTEIARFQGIVAMLLFLAVDGHHDLIYVFVRSYEIVPIGRLNTDDLLRQAISLGGKMFVLAVKLAAPVVVGLVVTNFLLGFLYKAAPQMNIFFVSFALYIAVGFLIMLLSLPVFMHVMEGSFGGIRDNMLRTMTAAGR
ncbi:MAG: flagellar biosynthetic protein FliR [Nitrospiraceae bacterium]|nr:flagellar biosynthetic protein FliR [Nitrospiraceae bacterium]